MQSLILYYMLLDLFEVGEQVSKADSDEDIIEGEGCLVGEENVGAEDHSPRPALKQAHRMVRIPGENIITGSKMNIFTATHTQHYRQAVHLAERNWSLNRNSANLIARWR